jgi:hypothetical protein
MTVERLLTESSSRELTEWQQFFVADAARAAERREQMRLERETGI